jgi:hypothetical protein
MAVSFRFWDDCIDPSDMEAMWRIPEVSTEWLDAGESRDQRVHLSRDPDGQPYLTQTEMKVNQFSSFMEEIIVTVSHLLNNICFIINYFLTFGVDSVQNYILVF